MKRLSDEDLEDLKREINEMRQVLSWLNKRIEAENDMGSSETLCAARDYVKRSIASFEADLVFMGKEEEV